MNERQQPENKTASIIKQLLGKSSPIIVKRELHQTEKNRALKLEALLAKLEAGEHVQNRTLKTWLTDDEYQLLITGWDTQKQLRDELNSKPEQLTDYEHLLKLADFTYNKAEAYSNRGKHSAAKLLFSQADRHYEKALERLQEIIADDPQLHLWFDRDTEWAFENTLSLSPVSVPRCFTSRSQNKLSSSSHYLQHEILTIAQFKLKVVQQAYNDLTIEQAPCSKSVNGQSGKLKALLNNHLDDDLF